MEEHMNTDLNNRSRSVGRGAVGSYLPTALAIHDLSCFGKCALTVILPTLSAAGVQTVPIPTALLSTHTGGFEGFYFEDMTGQMERIAEHLNVIEVKVDAIYTGFLGSAEQIKTVSGIIDTFTKEERPLVLIDPVMGDDGVLYSTYTRELMLGMRELCKKADVITPNITEACFLTDTEYKETADMTEMEASEYASGIMKKLKTFGAEKIAITGLHYDNNKVATYGYDNEIGEFIYGSEQIDRSYPGTGDLFASVLLAWLMKGMSFRSAVEKASSFTKTVIEYTSHFDTPIRNGVYFEPFLGELK